MSIPLSLQTKGNLLSRPAALASPALGLVWDFDNRLRGADTNGTPATAPRFRGFYGS